MGEVENLVEEEEEEMVVPSGTGDPIKRFGRFLKPRVNSITDVTVSAVPSLRNAVSGGKISWPPKKVVLEGWRYPQPKWKEWVDRLKPLFEHTWKKAGILDAVICSTYEIRRHPSVFFALLLYWCPDTNTFAFPWSEVTLTLEDVMVLGGFPVDGEPVRTKNPLSGENGEMLTKMIAERKGFNKLSSKKASHYEWIKHYMEVGRADELEHVAFLSLWLSRFVFPTHPGKTVSELMFPIAIRLSQGTRIALGPAVLASIYRDLRILRNYTGRMGGEEALSNFTVWAPFQLLQIWTWEHFVAFRTEMCPNFLQPYEPRASRWHGLDAKLDLLYVVSVLESPEEFQWRPYMIRLHNWRLPSFYNDHGKWFSLCLDKDDEDMRSYAHILRSCELVGVDCIEQYFPHRVAMQFGLDQDLPGCVPRANGTWELAWRTYENHFDDVKFYAPPRLFESDCTQRFFIWQQECWLSQGNTGENFMGQLELSQQEKHTSPRLENQPDAQIPLNMKNVKLDDQTESTYVNETANNSIAVNLENGSAPKSLSITTIGEQKHPPKIERKMTKKRMLTKIHGSKLRQGDAMHQIVADNNYALPWVKEAKIKQGDEACDGDFFNIEVKRVTNKVRNSMISSFYPPKMVDELEGTFSPSYNSLRMKEREQKAARLQKEMELDAQIERIKAEIAELHDDVMNMDSMNEVSFFQVNMLHFLYLLKLCTCLDVDDMIISNLIKGYATVKYFLNFYVYMIDM